MIDFNDDMKMVVIDTDTYAGNFERELTAYCTGQFGDCGKGSKIAEEFKKEFPEQYKRFSEIVTSISDEHGCYRPTSIFPTPGYFNDGLGHEYPESEWGSDRVKEIYLEAAKQNKLDKLEPGHYVAYLSVAIFFDEWPSDQDVNFIINRANLFKNNNRRNLKFNITNVRFVTSKLEFITVKKFK